MELSGKRILIIGLGKTGIAAVRFLARRGAEIVVTDEKPLSLMKEAFDELADVRPHFKFRAGGLAIGSDIDLVVPSPGVAPLHEILSEAVNRGIPVMSELELACCFLRRPMIAITGTNGKTTTTTLIGEILEGAGKKVFVGGNIGRPLIGYVDGKQEEEYVVIEVSSFQLQWISRFRPDIAILLNVTRDHVNYHGTFADYLRIKERIFENQTGEDIAILNAADPFTEVLSKKLAAGIQYFSSFKKVRHGMFLDQETLIYRREPEGTEEVYPRAMIRIPGIHNIENVMAAVMASRGAGCSREAVIKAVEGFKGIAHRIEFAGEKGGIAFYDDSKATNVDAVMRALETFSRPVILLMGGRDKEGDFENLATPVRQRVKRLVLFGEARAKIDGLIGGLVKTDQVATLGDAMELARHHASDGDVVLLSPGCASFDEFTDYKARGDFFKKWVGNLS
ncbi:MAG: UDP-N-acetylmuramoyl-L-alanine--D-glutamate ligase [Deltaproteobacteria bacterium]|nr:UDP-N-acetylmuramoyl-L-alanine--D-glutamate ligase [Deltaproteobacteria bacterium]